MTFTLRARIVFSIFVIAAALVAVDYATAPTSNQPPGRSEVSPAVAPLQAFQDWLTSEAEPAAAPTTPFLQKGLAVFMAQGCGACHTIRGLPESSGVLGPDLTHVGSRAFIAAGTLRGGIGNIAAWIASAQHLKPGNKMPSFDRLNGEELRSIAAYLASLK